MKIDRLQCKFSSDNTFLGGQDNLVGQIENIKVQTCFGDFILGICPKFIQVIKLQEIRKTV